MKLAILILAATLAFAKDKPPHPDPQLQADFWRATLMFNEVLPEFQKRDAAVKAAREKLDAACGKDHQLADDNGLKCVPKPKEPKK